MKTEHNEYDEVVPCERPTKYHFHLFLPEVLNWPKPQFKKLLTAITKTDSSRFTVDELRKTLLDNIANGHQIVPIGKCDNFDFKIGCLGHPGASSN